MLRRRVQRRTRLVEQQQPHRRVLRHHRAHERPRHREPLHLPTAERRPSRRARGHPARAAHRRVVDGPPEQRLRAFGDPGEVVVHGPIEVRVVALGQLCDEGGGAAESCCGLDVRVVPEVRGVPERDIVADLREQVSMEVVCIRIRACTERGKWV